MLVKCRSANPSFTLAAGSFTALPSPNRHFDAVISSFAFHEVAPAQRPAACAEADGSKPPSATGRWRGGFHPDKTAKERSNAD